MKVGDKIMCKKPLDEYINNFKKGDEYIIMKISNDIYAIYSELTNLTHLIYEYELLEYFYSPEEYRLLKLESL